MSPTFSTGPIGPNGRVNINVGGVRFETFASTCQNVPESRLSSKNGHRLQNTTPIEENISLIAIQCFFRISWNTTEQENCTVQLKYAGPFLKTNYCSGVLMNQLWSHVATQISKSTEMQRPSCNHLTALMEIKNLMDSLLLVSRLLHLMEISSHQRYTERVVSHTELKIGGSIGSPGSGDYSKNQILPRAHR